MQDQSIYSQIKPQFPEQEHLKCPRCDSPNTKFCYYNNYNLSQPRHYCKSCRRYWTKGGTLRNIPVGGGSRKATKRSASSNNLNNNNNNNNNNNKRASTTTTSCSVTTATLPVTSSGPKPEPFGIPPTTIDVSGPFSSLLASNGPQFGNLLEVLNANNGSSLQLGDLSRNLNSNSGLGSGPGSGSGSDGIPPKVNNMDGYIGDSNCWNGNNGWPDLAIYTPGSTFQ